MGSAIRRACWAGPLGAIAVGGSGAVYAAGAASVGVNVGVNRTRAYVKNSRVTALHDIVVSADDWSVQGLAVGAVSFAVYGSVGVSLGANTFGGLAG